MSSDPAAKGSLVINSNSLVRVRLVIAGRDCSSEDEGKLTQNAWPTPAKSLHQALEQNSLMDGDHIELEIEAIGKWEINVRDGLKRTWERVTRWQRRERASPEARTASFFSDPNYFHLGIATPQLTGKHSDIGISNAGISGGMAGLFEQTADDWAKILHVRVRPPRQTDAPSPGRCPSPHRSRRRSCRGSGRS
jgi:hypothetical protein